MAVALFVLRRREPELARPYRARLYPVLPALSLIIEVVFMVLYSWTDTVGILFAIGLAIACIPFALIARHGKMRT
jgi:amino acid transporter